MIYDGYDEIPVSHGPVEESQIPKMHYVGHVSSGFKAFTGVPGSEARCHWCPWVFECDDNSGGKAWEALYAHAEHCGPKPDARTVPK